MKLYVGTSGYSYKEWKGIFYPEKLPQKEMLRFYGTRFNSVESNSTFRGIPKESVLQSWTEQVPKHFRFSLKAPQAITHFKRLKDVQDETATFIRVAQTMGEYFGVILFQLPPNMKKDIPRLDAFLKHIPKKIRVSFEFRHASWFDDETFGLLKDCNAALCIADAEDDLEVPFIPTADWGYLRLRRVKYTPTTLKRWHAQISEQKWKEVFVFFKHEDEATGPKLAEAFVKF